MAEYGNMHFTICDNCHPGLTPVNTKRFGELLGTPGVFIGGADLAMEHFGWEEREYGHACPKCVAAEKADGEQAEASGEVNGPLYESDLPGATQVIKKSMKEYIAKERLDVKLAVERANEAIAAGGMPTPEDVAVIVGFVYADDWGSILPAGPESIPPEKLPEIEAEMERRLNEMGVTISKVDA